MRNLIWAALVLAGCAGGGAVEVPLDTSSSMPGVAVRVNGAGPFVFTIDTGFNETVLHSELADQLGGRIERLQIGAAEVVAPPFKVMDLKQITGTQGVIGIDVLRRFVVTIDPKAGRVSLKPIGSPPAGGVEIPFELRGGRIVAKGRLEGRAMVWWIHTGFATVGVVATLDAYVEAGVGVSTAVEADKRGERKITMVVMNQVTVGGLNRSMIPGLAGAFPKDLPDRGDIEGILSAPYFGGAALTFDFERSMIRVRE